MRKEVEKKTVVKSIKMTPEQEQIALDNAKAIDICKYIMGMKILTSEETMADFDGNGVVDLMLLVLRRSCLNKLKGD